jgi:CheY-like chemotaxis protein
LGTGPPTEDLAVDHGRPVLLIGGGLALLGALGNVLVTALARGGPFWSAGLQLTLYMLAAALVAALLGLIFGVPRARTETANDTGRDASATEMANGRTNFYSANSNLEQISDWLTKILVGAGLVQLGRLPSALRRLAEFLGDDIGIPNGEAVSIVVAVYGAGLGFLITYLWVRLRLRVLLESSEQQADEQSRQIREVASHVGAASARSEDPEPDRVISEVAIRASEAVSRAADGVLRRVLWVDDNPRNNSELVAALKSLGIMVQTELSTREALRALSRDRFGVIITDLGRQEDDGYNDNAGADLIAEARQAGIATPIIVYAGRRGMSRSQELLELGASFVTNRPTEVLERATDIITRG